ncbi:MAG: hypothetical protein HQL60_04560 [Magnetococcales bacterium]|nr:hypothetical protein [Magnetococcales bacterium]
MIPTRGLHIDQAPPLHIPLRFFMTAPLFMLWAGIVLLAWPGEIWIAPLTPLTVATFHLVVLGWITMTMFGAMYQMIPVLAGLPMPGLVLAPWVHGSLVVGVVSLFVAIGLDGHRWFLLLASAGLGLALGLFILQTGYALWRSPVRHPTIAAKRIALVSLTLTLVLGGLFLGEYAHGFFAIDRATLVAIHLVIALFGWVATLILGVSLQVLPMFYVMPIYPVAVAQRLLIGWSASLLLLPLALWWLGPEQPIWLWLAALPGVVGLTLYGRRLRIVWSQRKRKINDPSLKFWRAGLLYAVLALSLLACWPLLPDHLMSRFLFGVLFTIGFVTSIILAMLYKIVPFLVWFHRFSRLVGLVDTIPMMDDLVAERLGHWHYYWHQGTTIILILAVVTTHPFATIAAGVGLIIDALLWIGMVYSALRYPVPAT